MSEYPDIDLDRERVACVFALGGGELHEPHPDFPDEWGGRGGIKYWYEGPPEYATDLRDAHEVDCPSCGGTGDDPAADDEDCPACEGAGHHDLQLRTAIQEGLFGLPDPPEGWERIASFASSGEASCWWCGPGTGKEDERESCQLCEGDGYVCLGEGWCEVVLRRTVPGPR